MQNLPPRTVAGEITEKILSYLTPATLCTVEQVCVAWQEIVLGKDNVLWRRQLEFQLTDHHEWEVIYDRCCFHGLPDPVAGAGTLVPVHYTLASAGETWKERYQQVQSIAEKVSASEETNVGWTACAHSRLHPRYARADVHALCC